MIDKSLDVTRVTTIDGEDYIVAECDEGKCPFCYLYDGFQYECLHPKGDGFAYWVTGEAIGFIPALGEPRKKYCPLRVKE